MNRPNLQPKFTAHLVAVGGVVVVFVRLTSNVHVNAAHIVGVVPGASAMTRIMLAHSAPIDIADLGTPDQVAAEILRAIERAAGPSASEH